MEFGDGLTGLCGLLQIGSVSVTFLPTVQKCLLRASAISVEVVSSVVPDWSLMLCGFLIFHDCVYHTPGFFGVIFGSFQEAFVIDVFCSSYNLT